MAKKYSKHKNNKNSTEKDSSEFNSDEKVRLEILKAQQFAVILNIYGQVLLYEAAALGIELVKTNFKNNEVQIKADNLVKQAVNIFLIAGLISFELAIINYNRSCDDIRGGATFSIQPNIDLITANTLNVISDIYYIKAANGLYDRDNIQPIFGFR